MNEGLSSKYKYQHISLQNDILIKKAICPYCKKEMTGVYYQDEESNWFVCWICNCVEVIRLENKINE